MASDSSRNLSVGDRIEPRARDDRCAIARGRRNGGHIGVVRISSTGLPRWLVRGCGAVADGIVDAGSGVSVFAILTLIGCGMAAAAMLSIHPIVAASVLLAVFSADSAGVSDLALMGAALLGWSSAAMLSYSGLLVIVATFMFNVRRDELIFGRNMLLALAYAAIATLTLSILDLILD